MWPHYFPDQCPPPAARAEELRAYRLVDQAPPTRADFLPLVVEQPHRKFDPQLLCYACGVSVFKNIADLRSRMARYKPLRGKRIAACFIRATDGLILESFSDSHVTWWLRTDFPEATFREVIEDVSI